MNLAALIFLALAMSTDAFAAAIGKGAAMHKPRFFHALRIGVLFGVIEAITPIIGWLIGSLASRWVAAWDHWIAFALLLVLGGHMIRAGMKTDPEEAVQAPRNQSMLMLALTAVATSIDAMAVGVGLAFVNVSIVEAALLIGLATTVMVTAGVLLGRLLGSLIGKRAEIVGGLVLIGVGTTILYEHLAA
ncbi:MAG TPA: manganese efflux pump MntP [Herbaspirillum sp.]|jgi:putative Mn2+ efflux pump MntP